MPRQCRRKIHQPPELHSIQSFNHFITKMTVSEIHQLPTDQQLPTDRRPWRSTPLVESVALSKAAGWYIHHSHSPPHQPAKSQKQSLPQAREPPTCWLFQVPVTRPSAIPPAFPPPPPQPRDSTADPPSKETKLTTTSRGIGNYMTQRLLEHPSPANIHFYSSSGGNAGLACVRFPPLSQSAQPSPKSTKTQTRSTPPTPWAAPPPSSSPSRPSPS